MQFGNASIRAVHMGSIAMGALAIALTGPARAAEETAASSMAANAAPDAAQGHTTPPPPAQSENGDTGAIKDIVVTAQRREERLQSVPVAVTALSAARMADAGVASYTQLQEVTPGLLSQGSNGNATPFIRGIGALGTNPGNDSPIATYVDGVYISSKKSNLMTVTDSIERIEVLRGPQGTLFGRNSTGGAMRIITKDPSQDFKGSAQLDYGRFNDVGGQLYVTGGLSNTLAANLAASFERNDGYIRNLDPDVNHGGKYVGQDKSVTVRSKLKWTPTDNLRVTLAGDYAYNRHDSSTAQSALTGFITVPQLIYGSDNPIAQPTHKARTYNGTNIPISNDRNGGGSLEVVWNTGIGDLTSLTSYRYDRAHNAIDLDLTPSDYFIFEDIQITKTFQQEVRLASSGTGPFKWQGGVFYMHDNAGFEPLRSLLNTTLSPSPAELAADPDASRTFTYARQVVNSAAIFGDASYDFNGTTLTGGLRWTRDEVTFAGGSRQTEQVANASLTGFDEIELARVPHDVSKTFRELTYRINIDHKFGNDIMVYASFNRGYKSGVFNISDLTNLTPTKPEVVKAYEVGTKMDLFNRHLRLNLSAFYNDYQNLQVSVTDTSSGGGIQHTENAAEARIYGIEAEATIAASRDLIFNANLAYLNSKYTKYLNASVYEVGANGLLSIVPRDLRNAQTPFAPKFTFTIGAQYTAHLSGGSRIEFNGNYYYNSGYCIESGCLAIAKQHSYNMVNLSATWHAPNDRYFFRVYGKNLLNEKVYSGNTVTNFGIGVTWNEPVTWGIGAGVKF